MESNTKEGSVLAHTTVKKNDVKEDDNAEKGECSMQGIEIVEERKIEEGPGLAVSMVEKNDVKEDDNAEKSECSMQGVEIAEERKIEEGPGLAVSMVEENDIKEEDNAEQGECSMQGVEIVEERKIEEGSGLAVLVVEKNDVKEDNAEKGESSMQGVEIAEERKIEEGPGLAVLMVEKNDVKEDDNTEKGECSMQGVEIVEERKIEEGPGLAVLMVEKNDVKEEDNAEKGECSMQGVEIVEKESNTEVSSKEVLKILPVDNEKNPSEHIEELPDQSSDISLPLSSVISQASSSDDNKAIINSNILVNDSNDEDDADDDCTLVEQKFLDDILVNKYLKLLMKHFPNTIYVFDSFFFISLKRFGNTFSKNKVDLFQYEKIFFPIHHLEQWSLVYVDMIGQNGIRSIKFYTSNNKEYKDFPIRRDILRPIENYLRKQFYFHKNDLNLSCQFDLEVVKNCPQQKYQCDCGVYLCMFVEYLTKNVTLNITDDDVSVFRMILLKALTYDKLQN